MYFSIGQFTEAKESADGESLAVVLDLMRQIRSRRQMLRDYEPHTAA
jgi:hypothetical protein